ncbi:MAG: GDP-mannose 4,6-dehydratase [Planctomycetes bacterium]|nr:GDP-mannose 4,6-dehydratase [Planctomycetota bacterium]
MSERRRALVTGLTGQDGSYLAEFLLGKGYEVFGLVRRSSMPRLERVQGILGEVQIVYGDLIDQSSLQRVMGDCRPHEIYNLAAQSFVPTSFAEPVLTAEVTALGATRMLEAMRHVCPEARFYQASSSEMFGAVRETPQNELTPFVPQSPYGLSKLYAHWATVQHREAYGVFACSGILFNHESPRRGEEFVTRKIAKAAARISRGLQEVLYLGNLDARRDWGFAGDYVRAMWLMLQADEAADFVIATGETNSVRDFCSRAFERVGLRWEDHVETQEALIRPLEVDLLVGDASLAEERLGWEPTITFEGLVEMMVDAELAKLDASE